MNLQIQEANYAKRVAGKGSALSSEVATQEFGTADSDQSEALSDKIQI